METAKSVELLFFAFAFCCLHGLHFCLETFLFQHLKHTSLTITHAQEAHCLFCMRIVIPLTHGMRDSFSHLRMFAHGNFIARVCFRIYAHDT